MKNPSFSPGPMGKARMVCYGGICAGLCVMLQMAPVWLPAAGLALSPFSTLPAAVIAGLSPLAGVIAYLGSGAMLCILNIQEALIFAFGTGLLGLALGLFAYKGFIARVFVAGAALDLGMNLLFYVFGINLFGPATRYIGDFMQAIFALFSFAYASLWAVLAGSALRKILKISGSNKGG